jgi:hypothetical protein
MGAILLLLLLLSVQEKNYYQSGAKIVVGCFIQYNGPTNALLYNETLI